MLKEKAITLLKVRPDEIRMVTLIAALFLCIQAGQGFGENAAFALFLSSINVDVLPYMYMGLGGVVFLASIAYSASLTRFQNASVVINLLAGSFLLFAVEWIVIVLFGEFAFLSLSSAVVDHLWNERRARHNIMDGGG